MESDSSDVEIDIKLLLPLDVSPDDKPSSATVVYAMSDKDIYNPSQGSKSVLQKSQASSIWDVTDPNCTVVLQRKYTSDQPEEMNLKQYLASDSEGEEDSDGIPVAGPMASQPDSAFQPYRGRLKGQWEKVQNRGSLKVKSEEKGKNRQKKKIGRKKEKCEEERPDRQKKKNGKKISKKKNRMVWKIRKKGNTGKRVISSMCKKKHKKI